MCQKLNEASSLKFHAGYSSSAINRAAGMRDRKHSHHGACVSLSVKAMLERYLENLEICIGLWGDVSGSAGPLDSSDTREHFQLAANFHTNASPMISNLKRNFNLCKLKTSTHSMQ
jgi:hypothetical protein